MNATDERRIRNFLAQVITTDRNGLGAEAQTLLASIEFWHHKKDKPGAASIAMLIAGTADLAELGVRTLMTSTARDVAHWRQYLWIVLHDDRCLSYPAIGRLFGRDHSTIQSGCSRVRSQVAAEAAEAGNRLLRIRAL